MTMEPEGWRHKSGYRLNADGKSIEYEHIDRQLLAIVEAMVNEDTHEMEYYTVIFDTASSVWEPKVAHEIWQDKEKAQEKLREYMEEY